jgi:hypothetical protein
MFEYCNLYIRYYLSEGLRRVLRTPAEEFGICKLKIPEGRYY